MQAKIKDGPLAGPWTRAVAAAFLLCAGAAPPVHAAGNCDALRSEIEAKIAASGVARFTVQVVDAAAPINGRVVGSCELGSKKIVYEQQTAPPGSTVPVSGARRDAPMLTECKDGTESVGGDCRK